MSKSDRKTTSLDLRVTPVVKRSIEDNARALGLTVSAYVTMLLFKHVPGLKKRVEGKEG